VKKMVIKAMNLCGTCGEEYSQELKILWIKFA
jgi:hypothetical protein